MSFGATILDAEGLRLTSEEAAFFRDANPFGFILFGRNLHSADQIRALCDDMRNAVGRDAPITIDQEGGRVQRLRPPLARDWLPPLDFVGRAGENAPRAMYLRSRLIAFDLRALGIDSNCAPMADLARPETHAVIRNRCYGDAPGPVGEVALACAQGLLEGGVLPVAKHMPGHGRAVIDSHHDLPRVTTDAATLRQTDFAAFYALRDLPMGMTGHLVFEAFDDQPATISTTMLEMIRSEIGFGGLMMTDDLSMQALRGERPVLARAALDAGVDVVLFCNQALADRMAVAEACGMMNAASQARADAALAARQTPEELDIEATEAELLTLMQG